VKLKMKTREVEARMFNVCVFGVCVCVCVLLTILYVEIGWIPLLLLFAYNSAYIISRMIFYGVILLIARGWGITRDHLGKYKWLVVGTNPHILSNS
jgi:hypothetical protein